MVFVSFLRSAKKTLFNEKVANNVNGKGVLFEDNLQCQFNPSNFKILYVINSENCFYRRLALTRAKKVTFHINSINLFCCFHGFLYFFLVSQGRVAEKNRRFWPVAQ